LQNDPKFINIGSTKSFSAGGKEKPRKEEIWRIGKKGEWEGRNHFCTASPKPTVQANDDSKKEGGKMKKIQPTKPWVAIIAALLVPLFMAPAYAAQDKPITLKFSVWTPSPDVNMFSRANSWLVREVEKRSKGRLKVEYYWAGSLIPAKKTVDGLKSGIADLAFVNSDYAPGKLPLCTVGSLPVISHDYYTSSMALRELMKMPALKKELDANNIMYLGQVTNISLGFWTKQPVHSIADLKGKKIVIDGDRARVMKDLGVTPVAIISTEVYPAMEKGTVDGGTANPGYAGDYRWQEVAPYYFELMLGNVGDMFIGVNKDSWKKIPADIQKMFLDLQEEAIKVGHEMYQGNAEKNLREWVAKKIVTATKPSAADVALLEKTAKNVVWVNWVQKMEKRGLPGQQVLDKWIELNKKYAKLSPFK
jgi:TRAP-type C4-dicarboxylate transport system substrate-binding protein